MSIADDGRRPDPSRPRRPPRAGPPVCRCDDLGADRGVCALVDGRAVAVFRCSLRRRAVRRRQPRSLQRRLGAVPGLGRHDPGHPAARSRSWPRRCASSASTSAPACRSTTPRSASPPGTVRADATGSSRRRWPHPRAARPASSRATTGKPGRNLPRPAWADVTLGSLSGYTIAITADRRREEQAELIERRGGDGAHGPVDPDPPAGRRGRPARWPPSASSTEPPDIVVLCTALGVRGWISAAESLGLDDRAARRPGGAEVVVRGPKAAGAALTAGLKVDVADPGRHLRASSSSTCAEPEQPAPRRPTGARRGASATAPSSAPLLTELPALGYEVVAGARLPVAAPGRPGPGRAPRSARWPTARSTP